MDNMQPNMNNMQPNMNNMQPNMNNMGVQQNSPLYTKYLILSILQLLCCNQITGIIALVFTITANTAFKIGNYMEYEQKIKTAKTVITVGFIIGIILWVLVILLYAGLFGLGILASLNG